jgi:hypothetical protein
MGGRNSKFLAIVWTAALLSSVFVAPTFAYEPQADDSVEMLDSADSVLSTLSLMEALLHVPFDAASTFLLTANWQYPFRDADSGDWQAFPEFDAYQYIGSMAPAAARNDLSLFPAEFSGDPLDDASASFGMRLNSGWSLSLAYETIDTSHRDAPVATRSSIGPVYEGPVIFATVEF